MTSAVPSPAGADGTKNSDVVRIVLDLVDTIPRGKVMTYGDIAHHVGMRSPRQVGQIMARHGHEVPWQRVVRADGSPASHNPREHLARLRSDRVPVVNGRVDLAKARWRPPSP
jgi:methylated-DNA-protein-cysteine methyltransferase related protein